MEILGTAAVVTGGASGIGLEIVKRLLILGAKVTIWDNNREALDSAKEELQAFQKQLFSHYGDITDAAGIGPLVQQAEEEMGAIDILINNAGFFAPGNFLDQDPEQWAKTIDINLTAMIRIIHAVLPGMYQRDRGHIINISSAAGLIGVAGMSAYSASKWGVMGLTESLRHETRNLRKNVHFSSIHPMYIQSGMFGGAKIKGIGGILVPQVKNHGVIAEAVVQKALQKQRLIIHRPRTVRLTPFLRGLLPYRLFLGIVRLLNIHRSMNSWHGPEEKQDE